MIKIKKIEIKNIEELTKELKVKGISHEYLCLDLHNRNLITFEFNQSNVDLKQTLTKTFKNISFANVGIFNYIKDNGWAKGDRYKATLTIS